MDDHPRFFLLFLDSIKTDYKSGGAKMLIPYIFTACIGIGFIVAFSISDYRVAHFPFAFIAALITAQGIILAMSMQTTGIILSNISQGEFSIFLKSKCLLNYYMLLVQLIQMIHVISLFLLVGTAVVSILDYFNQYVFRVSLAISLSGFLYALRWTLGTSTIVRDLIYYRSEFQYMEEVKKVSRDREYS
jgi:hypothetical protein